MELTNKNFLFIILPLIVILDHIKGHILKKQYPSCKKHIREIIPVN